jgi:hypothetical protein
VVRNDPDSGGPRRRRAVQAGPPRRPSEPGCRSKSTQFLAVLGRNPGPCGGCARARLP